MDDDKYRWKEGDVLIHKNEAERDKALAEEGYEWFIEPGRKPRKLKKEEKEQS